ncbi:MAG: hypothetical protein ACI9U2_004275 [Bradymonadia bacterium]|jgi:hypothetical protein
MRWMVPSSGVMVVVMVFGCGEAKTPTPAPTSDAPASKASGSDAPASTTPAPVSKAAPATRAAAVTVAPVVISHVLTPAEQDARQALALKILDGKLKGLALRNRKNAVIFRDLAAKHPHPRAVAGGLSAMGRTFSTRKGQGMQVDEDYRKVVRVRMRASNPLIKVAALDAARLLLSGTPDPAFLDAVIKMSQDADPTSRTAAVGALVSLPVVQAGEAVADPLYLKVTEALMSIEYVADSASLIILMERMARTIDSKNPAAPKLAAVAKQHQASKNAGVKGAANLLMATTSTDKVATAKVLVADLKHANAYVRGATIEALGLLANPSAVHAIMPLLGDTAQAVYSVETEPEPIPLRLDYGRTVQAVALGALRALSKKSFDYKRDDLRTNPTAIIDAAKAWYAKTSTSIPKL